MCMHVHICFQERERKTELSQWTCVCFHAHVGIFAIEREVGGGEIIGIWPNTAIKRNKKGKQGGVGRCTYICVTLKGLQFE